ncbi:MAG: hypothetical protein AB7K24_19135 [Gemmataceae bacterium]
MNKVVPPFWVVQRQIKMESLDEQLMRLTGPNLPEEFIGIRKGENGLWLGYVRSEREGEDVASCPPEHARALDAWYAAFELYRNLVIV